MTYRFHRCQPHAKCPDLTGWYLELHPNDNDTLMQIHRGVTYLYYNKFGLDPHIDPTGPYNPIKLAAQWLLGIQSYVAAGEAVLVNSNGGYMPLAGAIILETVESDELDWNIRYPDEIITIGRWPGGKHFYLWSNKDRIFVPGKYTTYPAARVAALRHVPAERIKGNC